MAKKQYHCLITARKPSLWQGNIFIGVCQEFCSQGGGVCSRGAAPREGCICSRGEGVPGGDPQIFFCILFCFFLAIFFFFFAFCFPFFHHTHTMVNEWVVRILLECILVKKKKYLLEQNQILLQNPSNSQCSKPPSPKILVLVFIYMS